MPRISVNGATIAYEIHGEKGPPVVFTCGGWSGMKKESAQKSIEELSANCRLMIWDRRNCETSDVGISDAPSEWHLWTDDLHEIINSVGMSPAYMRGISAGNVFSILMADKYPEDVRGLILESSPTDDLCLLHVVAQRYFLFADIADKIGMKAVIETARMVVNLQFAPGLSSVTNAILVSRNQDRLLRMDPKKFSMTMHKWADWLVSDKFYRANLSEKKLSNINVPVLIVPGKNEVHPPRSSTNLHRLMPNARLFLNPDRELSPEQQKELDGLNLDRCITNVKSLPKVINDFIKKTEKGKR